MSWPIDEGKLARVREAMAEQQLDALVVRAPDNVLYLGNYLSMKGYDVLIFPREGPMTLIVVEPQLEDAHRQAWTDDIRPFDTYDPQDARPPTLRSQELAIAVLRERDLLGRVAIELSQGTQSADLMVGEPTTPTKGFFDAFEAAAGEVVDASGLLAQARMIKTPQEIERMRLANALAYAGMEHLRERFKVGMRASEVAAIFEGHVHEIGVGFQGKVDWARAYTLVWCGSGIRTFTPTVEGTVVAGEPTLLEIWVCADGYWTDLTKNLCVGPLAAPYEQLLESLLDVYGRAIDFARPGASLPELDRLLRAGIADAGYPGQPSHSVCHGVGARAHEPPFAHQAAGGEIREGMALAIEPGAYWPDGGGLRLEDVFLIGPNGAEAMCGFPDDFREVMV